MSERGKGDKGLGKRALTVAVKFFEITISEYPLIESSTHNRVTSSKIFKFCLRKLFDNWHQGQQPMNTGFRYSRTCCFSQLSPWMACSWIMKAKLCSHLIIVKLTASKIFSLYANKLEVPVWEKVFCDNFENSSQICFFSFYLGG